MLRFCPEEMPLAGVLGEFMGEEVRELPLQLHGVLPELGVAALRVADVFLHRLKPLQFTGKRLDNVVVVVRDGVLPLLAALRLRVATALLLHCLPLSCTESVPMPTTVEVFLH